MPRFVVLHHLVGTQLERTERNHFDWMFEVDGALRTFATTVIDSLDQSLEVDAQPLDDHRIDYLDFEGEIAGNRGYVRRVIAGTYVPLPHSDHTFAARLAWRSDHGERIARVEFYRSFTDSCFSWRLLFSS